MLPSGQTGEMIKPAAQKGAYCMCRQEYSAVTSENLYLDKKGNRKQKDVSN